MVGFHGCDEAVGHETLNSTAKHLNPGSNRYDWLGTGIYIWENDRSGLCSLPGKAWAERSRGAVLQRAYSKLLRPLDRTVITHMHDIRGATGKPEYQTVRAGFAEGDSL